MDSKVGKILNEFKKKIENKTFSYNKYFIK